MIVVALGGTVTGVWALSSVAGPMGAAIDVNRVCTSDYHPVQFFFSGFCQWAGDSLPDDISSDNEVCITRALLNDLLLEANGAYPMIPEDLRKPNGPCFKQNEIRAITAILGR